ncbi:RusA family crossover junction endodeoxyribonuclease [Marinisporobacter balticus]|uniref:Endodeoxyribonuclease RusA n=1 Tax=Marinisporobacter balticus TaxID=2018667 RepID=A0A4R2L2R8_9FIRM|nr:RusA family crossover junction endodeoxyribonuclease [Marinisporobacter balticus]TCO79517.1 endodeoxyribonuclease RusA [Marinisporobacter balticus]
MIKIIVPGKPISKSNFKLKNIHGQVWMPREGKHGKYIAYENKIAGFINQQYTGPTLTGNIITIIHLYFLNKRMGDLHNYPKSICDGIEKSGIIENDRQLKPVLLFDYIDKDHPRIEIELYECSKYKVSYSIESLDE